MKNINALAKACLYKEGAVMSLIAGIIFYFIIYMSVSYDPMNNVIPVLMGLGICSVPAILVVMMTTGIRALETRKTIGLFPSIRISLLQLAFLICAFGTAFVIPFFYLAGLNGPKAFLAVATLFFSLYSSIFISGALFAKYITPALSFAIVVLVIPIGLFLLKAPKLNFYLFYMVNAGSVFVWFCFSIYWLNKKQDVVLDDGQNWVLRLRNWIARLMHFSQFSTIEGTFLLNNGDGAHSMVKRSLIILTISSIFLVLPYLLLVKEHSLSASILFLFYAVQFIYVELSKGNKIPKSIWLLGGDDRMYVFKRRAQLHMKLAAFHCGLFIFILLLVQLIAPLARTSENINALILIAYYLVMHFAFVSIPTSIDNITIFPFIYLPLAFGNKVFEMNVSGHLSLIDNPFAVFLVLGYPPIAVFIAALAKRNLRKYDFSQKSKIAGFLGGQGIITR